MKRLIAPFLIVTCLLSLNALAKRIGPAPVKPIEFQGVKYIAPNSSGVEGKIEAQDAKTGKKLWDAVIYRVHLKPDLEQDVQWVFITQLSIHDNSLLITNERDKQFRLDLSTKKVEEVKPK